MEVRLGNFNVENLFSRYSILNLDPATREKLEEEEFKTLSMTKKTRKGQEWHQLKREPIAGVAQQNTAKVIDVVDADIICLQEVEDLPTLRNFADQILGPIQKDNGHKLYSYFMLVDGNDIRGIDVAIMSRYPFGKIQTHMYEQDETGWPLFSRDSLEVEILLRGEKLHFFIQHFKSQISRSGDKNGIKKRTRQAKRVAKIVQERIAEDRDGYYIVAGDLNDTPDSNSLRSLLASRLNFYNAINELPSDERWTYIHGRKKQQFDYLLVSPNLKTKIEKFHVERRGLSRSRTAYRGERFSGVARDGTEASDHCAVLVDLEV